jgi:hypothetical protein
MRWGTSAAVILRQQSLIPGAAGPRFGAARCGACVLFFGSAYGAIMGTFGGVAGERLWQVVYSAVKVPMLLLVTFFIGLPSFFVFNTLCGLRDDFRQALRALWATQAVLTIILASLAPYTLLWYASSSDYETAVLFNGLMFAVASLAAQWLLRRRYRPLVARNRRHRFLLRVWLVLYVFIGVQMAWVLRPFVGNPQQPTEFLREEAWDNAYVIVFRTLCHVLGLR